MPPRRFKILTLLVAAAAISAPAARTEEPKAKGKPNRLAKSSSPYLLQHAHNPVDWHPWGPEALALAKKEGKLVFLSIGYSSCHWCHVMERESFSNPAVADILNKNFICIKVDREERPDVDEVYMSAIQALGMGGGWPLSMFLTPEGKPIFGGTYWPPDDKKVDDGTIPGFKSVLARVIELNRDSQKELFAQADKVAKLTVESMERNTRPLPLLKLDAELVTDAANSYQFDPEHGGQGFKPSGFKGTKFPRVPVLLFVLHQSKKPAHASRVKEMAFALERMAAGGIYDHLGGGFHRYSTERTWTVPHFEKMLYDNAQLVELYSEAFAGDANPLYKRVVAESLDFVARELTSPDGAFYSALDADSEGKEGEFYVWAAKQLDDALGTGDDAKLFRAAYVSEKPNFEGKQYILRLNKPLPELAKDAKLTEDELLAKVAPLKAKLFDLRAKRERPFLDTKVLAGWNGQMIAGYAAAGKAFKEPKYLAAAEKAAEFVLTKLTAKDGRLMRVYAARPGEKPEAYGPAFLDDYAFVIHGLLNLHDATGKARYLDEAKRLAGLMQQRHGDERGGFYVTASDAEKLFARGKDYYDGAQPSGNGVAARDLVRLWEKSKDEKDKAAAEKALRSLAPALKSNPQAAPVTADALDRLLGS